MEDLRGRTAVVTGGGSGIGRALCLTFAGEAMNVVVADIDAGRAREVAGEIGARALAVACDVSDATSVEALADAAYGEFGAVHVLCNNAGVVGFGPAAEASQDDWDWMFGVNVWGVVNGVRTFVPRIRAQGTGGHVVNTASLAGLMPTRGIGVYVASKYAVVGLSETLRAELREDAIGVSVLCPGGVQTRIGESARGAPSAMGIPRIERDTPAAQPAGMDPMIVGACVRDAVKANRLYVLTHADGRTGVERRFNRILGDFAFAH